MYVSRRLSKRELEKVVYRVLGVENIRKHNKLLLALLADVSSSAERVHEGRSLVGDTTPRCRD